MSTRINLVQSDNNIKLIFNLKKDGRVEPILGSDIDIQFINSVTGHVMKRKCTVTESSSAEFQYVLTSEDTKETGGFTSEITITFSNSTKVTILKPVILVISPQLVEG